MGKSIDLEKLIAFLYALKEHSYEAIGGNGESIHRFDETTVSYSRDGHFLCYTTVIDRTLYSFYSDLVLVKSESNGTKLADDADFEAINSLLALQQDELDNGLILRSDLP